MNKKRITKYTRSLTERQREQQLQNQIESLKKQLAAQKQRSEHEISVLKGKLEKATRRVSGLKKQIAIHNKVEEAHIQVIKAQKARIAKISKPKTISKDGPAMSKEERMKTMYIPQFMKRIREHYGNAFNAEQYNEILNILLQANDKDIYALFNQYGIETIMFESDATYTSIDASLEAAELYDDIKQLER